MVLYVYMYMCCMEVCAKYCSNVEVKSGKHIVVQQINQ